MRRPEFLLLADRLGFTCRRSLACLLRLTILPELRGLPELRRIRARLLALARGANLIVMVAAVTVRSGGSLRSERIF